jgi:hypothetical protein
MDGAASYVAAGSVLALAGDDAVAQVTLPFPVALYGGSYSTAWVDTNGVVSFVDPGGPSVSWGTHIPSVGRPDAAVFPFWDDLDIDGSASVRTATTGSAPNRQFVVEWRNARFYSSSDRITAEVIFSEATGEISFVYTNLAASALGQGSSAVVGIENADGAVGFEYSYHQGVLSSDHGVTFRPPA